MLLRVLGLVLVLAVALVVAPSLALAEEKGDVTREGTLVKVTTDKDKHTVTVLVGKEDKAKERTYDVAEKAKISCDGKECSLADLGKHEKAHVKLTLRGKDKERKIVEISAKTK